MQNPVGSIANGLAERRTIAGALADLEAKHERRPNAELARMIEQLRADIAQRQC